MQLLVELTPATGGYRYVLPLNCSRGDASTKMLGVRLRKCGPNEFVRENLWSIGEWDESCTLFCSDTQKDRYLKAEIETQTPTQTGMHDFIGQQRSHVLQIKLPPEMWQHLFHIQSGYRFDGEDRVFLTDGPEYDSAMVRLRGSLVPPSQGGRHTDIAFECMFCALGWSSTDETSLQSSLLDYRAHSAALADLKSDIFGYMGLVRLRAP